MSGDLISREAALKAIRARAEELEKLSTSRREKAISVIVAHKLAGIVGVVPAVDDEPVITGETSDGYHTFNELYHHRAVLFSVIVKAFPEKAWKAKKHDDGSMYDGMFIVGIETPDGQATYHYDIDPYWDMFKC